MDYRKLRDGGLLLLSAMLKCMANSFGGSSVSGGGYFIASNKKGNKDNDLKASNNVRSSAYREI